MEEASVIKHTPAFRCAVLMAREEANRLGHETVTDAHLVLGIVKYGEGIGAKVVRDVVPDTAAFVDGLAAIADRLPCGGDERADEVAGGWQGARWVGTEHLLVACMADERVADQVGCTVGDVVRRIEAVRRGSG